MDYPVNYDSPADLKEFLESKNFSMKKRFGQNFLVNRGGREKIIDCLQIKKGRRVWEIGPGLGALTWHLLELDADVTVFEIDHGFIECLEGFYGRMENFQLIEGDFLKSLKKIGTGEVASPDYILGNLPYITGSVMIAEIIKSSLQPKGMAFTLQKEVGQRMAAKPGGKEYSSFSLVCQSKYDIIQHGDLKPGSFYPRPAVQSAVVELRPHGRFNPGNPEVFYQLIEDLFHARRKKISNNLASGRIGARLGKDALLTAVVQAGISPDIRAEEMTVEQIEYLSRLVAETLK